MRPVAQEGEKDWERAESWYSRQAERYPDSAWAVWYLFCKRTDQGNLEAAREFAERYVTEHADRPDDAEPGVRRLFLLAGRTAGQGKGSLQQSLRKKQARSRPPFAWR